MWVNQFDPEERLPVLDELNHVLKRTYLTEANMEEFLIKVAANQKFVGADAKAFWKSVGVLRVQTGGNSQNEMLERLERILNEHIGIGLDECRSTSGTFLYIDDAVFSGNRVKNDLEPWIENVAPQTFSLRIVVGALHTNGKNYADEHLKKIASSVGKTITTNWWQVMGFENQKFRKNSSEVLWPSELPPDVQVSQYVETLKTAGFPPVLRVPGETPKDGVFSGEVGRATLERALLRAGVRVRSICTNLRENSRPLGFTPLKTLGFGTTVVTFRNCPNNAPLAFWAGSPWYPLFRRKTN